MFDAILSFAKKKEKVAKMSHPIVSRVPSGADPSESSRWLRMREKN